MSPVPPRLAHATAIARGQAAALIRGASGSGKSDLALRCLALPAGPLFPEPVRLVSDDQVLLRRDGTDLVASAPPAIAGRIEVRGIGIVAVPAIPSARLVLVVDLVAAALVERLPERCWCDIEGVRLPLLQLAPFEASAAAKLLLAIGEASGKP